MQRQTSGSLSSGTIMMRHKARHANDTAYIGEVMLRAADNSGEANV
jgi:hypothetical protein